MHGLSIIKKLLEKKLTRIPYASRQFKNKTRMIIIAQAEKHCRYKYSGEDI